MKRLFVFGVVSTLLLGGCEILGIDAIRGTGDVVSEERAVEGIEAVTLATLGELTIELGDQESLVVEAQQNLMEHLITEVRNGELTIRTENGVNLSPTEPVRYRLTVTGLDRLSITSSGDIDAPALEGESFTAHSSSSGDMLIAGLTADNLIVEISSSGGIEIQDGQVGHQEVNISSSGNYEAGDLQSESAVIDLSSSGNATVWVTDRLDANLSSSGDVYYYGSPGISQTASSSGRVVDRGDK
jgi:hypothetical protein